MVVTNASNQHSVVVNDATATLGGGLSGTNRVAFDGVSTTYAITANTATSITFTPADVIVCEI